MPSFYTTLRYIFAVSIFFSGFSHAQEQPIFQLDPGGHMASIRSITFSADGRLLVSAGEDRVIRVWDIERGETIRTLRGEIDDKGAGRIYSMALSPDNRLLAVGGQTAPFTGNNYEDAAAIRLYDFASGALISRYQGHRAPVSALAFSADGRSLLSGSIDREAILWDVDNHELQHRLIGHAARIYAATFSSDGQHAITGSEDGKVLLWDARTGKRITTMPGHDSMVGAIASAPHGVVATGSKDRSIRLWDSADGQQIKLLAEQDNEVGSLSFCPDGQYLLAGPGRGSSYPALVYRTLDGKLMSSYRGHDNAVYASAISPNERWAATAGGSRHEIHLWPFTQPEPDPNQVKVLAGIGSSIWSVGFSKDGRWLAWGKTQNPADPGNARLEYEIRLPDEQDVLGVPQPVNPERTYLRAITQHGDWRLAPAVDKFGRIERLEIRQKNKIRASIEADKRIVRLRAFTFTADGKRVIVAGTSGAISAYDLQGEHVADFGNHNEEVWALAVSPDGLLLASASADQTLKVWDVSVTANDKQADKLLLTLFHGANSENTALAKRGMQRVQQARPHIIGEWIAWTPAGYYSASADGDRYIGWHVNRGLDHAADYFPVARFAQQRYAPDVVSDTVRLRSEAEAITRSNKRQSSPTLTTVATLLEKTPKAPRLVQSPPALVSSPEHELTIEYTDTLIINVNGRPLELQRGFKRPSNPTQSAAQALKSVTRVITLKPGANRIELLARNDFGDSPVVGLNVDYQPPQPIDQIKPNLFLFAIGVSDYQNDELNLGFASSDAAALIARFQQEASHRNSLYGQVHTKALLDQQATKADVLDAMSFFDSMNENDLAILFVAGHGMQDEQENFFFLPHDIDINDLFNTGIKWDQFHELTSRLPGKVMLLADTCHSGSIYGTRGRRAALDMTRIAKDFSDADSGVIVFASSMGQEYAEESPAWRHGAFTKTLLDGLSGAADLFRDGSVRQSELETYVKHGVAELTKGRQHPVTISPGALPDFVLALVP